MIQLLRMQDLMRAQLAARLQHVSCTCECEFWRLCAHNHRFHGSMVQPEDAAPDLSDHVRDKLQLVTNSMKRGHGRQMMLQQHLESRNQEATMSPGQ